jgi:uncharacterized protein (DUF433 family)
MTYSQILAEHPALEDEDIKAALMFSVS